MTMDKLLGFGFCEDKCLAISFQKWRFIKSFNKYQHG
uniref:Uncharacterized protein n=1 Tax=Anguilla anguilla TaxID=7936 RepID=A0A0E9VKZ1_ANGAN